LQDISPAVAKGLRCIGGDLFLNGLASVSSEVAQALSSHRQKLWLTSLSDMTDEAAIALATDRLVFVHSDDLCRTQQMALSQAIHNHKGKGLILGSYYSAPPVVAQAWQPYSAHLTATADNTPGLQRYLDVLRKPETDSYHVATPKKVPPSSDSAVTIPASSLAGPQCDPTLPLDMPTYTPGNRSDTAVEQRLKQLECLIGLAAVKQEIVSLIGFLRVQQLRKQSGLKAESISRHLVFSGNPGTGKTTVARILGGIYSAAGFLSKGHTIETDRSGLVGEFVGHTAPKTLKVCERAAGGVLFIDEAYALTPPDHFGSDFGKEAIDALLKFMEDNREDLVVIVAGYPRKMDAFLESNPGLASRFTTKLHFENYTPAELLKILHKLCSEGEYLLSAGAEQAALKAFIDESIRADESFGNGRYVRNCYQQALIEHGRRVSAYDAPTTKVLQTLEAADFLR
jgi:hypothetical protein